MSDLDCNEIVELVTAFLDRSLDPEVERHLVDHLTSCDGCQEYIDQIQHTIRLLGELPPDRLSDSGRSELLDAFRSRRE